MYIVLIYPGPKKARSLQTFLTETETELLQFRAFLVLLIKFNEYK
jgi:hypothetical protein